MKAAFVVLADKETHEGLGRVVNAMVGVQEMKEAGDEWRGGGGRQAPRRVPPSPEPPIAPPGRLPDPYVLRNRIPVAASTTSVESRRSEAVAIAPWPSARRKALTARGRSGTKSRAASAPETEERRCEPSSSRGLPAASPS